MRLKLTALHEVCTKTLEQSFEDERAATMAESALFADDLSAWREVVTLSGEHILYERAEQECIASLLNVAQGQYCNAFKGLRLVMELVLQGVYLSANIVELHEWLRNSADTNWAQLMDLDKGPISKRYCDSFFPELKEHSGNFWTIAKTLYRELSETIHGNVPKHIPLPSSFQFDQAAFDMWHNKVKTVRMVCAFCLSVRYLKFLNADNKLLIEQGVTDQLGHIESIRVLFGGPTTL